MTRDLFLSDGGWALRILGYKRILDWWAAEEYPWRQGLTEAHLRITGVGKIIDSVPQLGWTDLIFTSFDTETKHKISELWKYVEFRCKEVEELLCNVESAERITLPYDAEAH